MRVSVPSCGVVNASVSEVVVGAGVIGFGWAFRGERRTGNCHWCSGDASDFEDM